MAKASQRKISYRGREYECTKKNGKVTVRSQRTACGQNIVVGTFNTIDGLWENRNPKTELPRYVKDQIEKNLI